MRGEKVFATYITMNKWNTVIYIGITSALWYRVFQHKNKLIKGFTYKYNVDKLVHLAVFETPEAAILREKQLKGWRREKKLSLIRESNPDFQDLLNDENTCHSDDE